MRLHREASRAVFVERPRRMGKGRGEWGMTESVYKLRVRCDNCGNLGYQTIPFGVEVEAGRNSQCLFRKDRAMGAGDLLKCKACGSTKLRKEFE